MRIWWDELSESQQQLLKDGLEDITNGNVVSSEQFWNKLKAQGKPIPSWNAMA